MIKNISKEDTVKPISTPDKNILTAAKGGSVVMAGRLFNYSCRLVMAIVLARLLGAREFGLYNLGLTAVEISAVLASLGLGTALVRFIPIFVSRRDEARLWGALQVCIGVATILSVLFGIGIYSLADVISQRWFHEPKLAPLLRLISFVIPFFTLNDMIASATQGFKNMHYTVIAQNLFRPLARFVFVGGLAIVGLNAGRALTASGLAEVLTSLLLLYFLNKQFSLKLPLQRGRRETKDIMRFSLPVYLSSLIGTFGSQIQTILLGTFSTVADIGINILARKVNLLGEIFHFSIVTASQPVVSDLHSRGEKEELGRFYQTMNKWTFTLNFPMFLIVLLFPGPILSVFGKSFADGIGVLTILAWRSLVDTGTGICGVMLGMTGNTHFTFLNTATTYALLIGLNFLLIPRWGLVGAATASLIASAVINLLRLIEVYILLKLLPYNLSFLKPVVAGFVALLAALATFRVLPSEAGLIHTALNVVVLLATYAGMILLLGLSSDDRAVVSGLQRRLAGVLCRS